MSDNEIRIGESTKGSIPTLNTMHITKTSENDENDENDNTQVKHYMNDDIKNTDSTSNAKVEEVVKTQLNVNENANTTEKKPLCFKIYYNSENPNDSKIELCETNNLGGKTQKKKRSLKPLKRKTIHKKLKFRKTPKKKHPRRRSIRK